MIFFTRDILAVTIIGGCYWHLVSRGRDDRYPAVFGPVPHSDKLSCILSDSEMSCWALSRTYSSSKRTSHFLFLSTVTTCNWSCSIVPIPMNGISYFLLFYTQKSGLFILMLIVVLFLRSSMPQLFHFSVHLVQNHHCLQNPHLFIFFYWGIVDLQCCANLCCTAKWLSYTCTCIYSFSNYFPI